MYNKYRMSNCPSVLDSYPDEIKGVKENRYE